MESVSDSKNALAATTEIRWLDEVSTRDVAAVGGKAANLGELKRSGFLVPDGFVVLGEPGPGLASALERLGGRVAVRSSAIAEDLADASFAGQYETILNINGLQATMDAIERCRASALNARVAAYKTERGLDASSVIAVLVQHMVDPHAAGVAFTANPVTGDRTEVVVSAVSGLGERLVSGEGDAEQWVIRDGHSEQPKGSGGVIDAEQAVGIAEMAQRIAAHFGRPQDVEWAIADGRIYVLQARPMTALPQEVDWRAPGPGYWMRNLRLGEWLPEPVTPLFADWLLALLSAGFAHGNRIDVGLGAGLRSGIVNGWYYSTPQPDVHVSGAVRGILTKPLTLARFVPAALKQSSRPEVSERRFFARVVQRWRSQALPRYRALVDAKTRQIDSMTVTERFNVVDEVGEAAGEQFWCLAIGGGSAWKVEVALAKFFRQHLASKVDAEPMSLLVGLSDSTDHSAMHLVESLDWYRQTLGELDERSEPRHGAATEERRRILRKKREAAEAACRRELAGEPHLVERFDQLVSLAQAYSRLREEQAFTLTLGWPLLRRCVLTLGATAVSGGGIEAADDAFFLTRSELEAATSRSSHPQLRGRVVGRKADWERQRKLSPPLSLGEPPKLLRRAFGGLELLRAGTRAPDGSLHGEPASPGRASGPVRVIRGPEDFASFREGEVLVAQATAPAWTPLFAKAAAVVTDGGSLAAHASLVAREYGIPAVVATGDATVRLTDGQHVTVDGSGGFVKIVE